MRGPALAILALVLALAPSVVRGGWPTVVFPSAPGITLLKGHTYTIEWASVRLDPVPISLIKNVDENTIALVKVISSAYPNPDLSGTFSWTVPSNIPNGSNYGIQVGVLGVMVAFSENSFTISDDGSSTGGAPTITTASPLPTGAIDTAYSQTLQASAGTAPYTWSVTSGTLPGGLGLVASSGAITGTPTVVANVSFRVRATGADSLFSEKDFSLTIGLAPAATLAGSWASNLTGKCKQTKAGLSCSGKGKLLVTNTGTAASLPSSVTFYLSTGCVHEAGDLQLGSPVTLKAVKPGKAGKASLKATLPVGLDPVGLYVIAVIGPDGDNNVVCYGPLQ